MHYKTKENQLQYEGYVHTPLLWNETHVFGLMQFDFQTAITQPFNESLPENLRLGKRVERFVSYELQNDFSCTILAENIQIQHDKLTLGELDLILLQNRKPIHLEIVFKFYLYDIHEGNTELDHWIGPNRNDTLINKLEKLKNKQLPLLYSPFTESVLNNLHLSSESILQRVWFKAQLFTPYQKKNIPFNLLNKSCLKGFYIKFSMLEVLSENKFYIPNKINWLQDPQKHINWLNYTVFYNKVGDLIKQKTSPLCWIKFTNGTMQKFFVVWWD